MDSIVFITVEEVIKIHNKQILMFGGATGIRDHNLLISAINMPLSAFGGMYLYSDIYQMAAAYMYYIIKNHAFIEGVSWTEVFKCMFELPVFKYEVQCFMNQCSFLSIL